MLADKVDYAFHLGVTEAGTPTVGSIKSAVGLGTLLAEGIGDTIRVSLAADPVEEVRVGNEILKALGFKKDGLTFVACPSCGRADVDLVGLAKTVEERMCPTAISIFTSRSWAARSTDRAKRAQPTSVSPAAKASA